MGVAVNDAKKASEKRGLLMGKGRGSLTGNRNRYALYWTQDRVKQL